MKNKYLFCKETLQSLDKNREIMRNNMQRYKQKQWILLDFQNYHQLSFFITNYQAILH